MSTAVAGIPATSAATLRAATGQKQVGSVRVVVTANGTVAKRRGGDDASLW